MPVEEVISIRFKGDNSSLASAANGAVTSLGKLKKATGDASQTLTDLSRVASDAPYGFIGIQNNLNPLLESFKRLKSESGSTKAALSSLVGGLTGAGGLGLALSVVSSLAVVFSRGMGGAGEAAKKAAEETDKYGKLLQSAFATVSQEAAKVEVLVASFQKENISRSQKLAIINELQQIAPAYFGNLNAEKATIDQLTNSYKNYSAGLIKAAQNKVLQKQLEDIIDKRLQLEKDLNPDTFVIDEQGRKTQRFFYEDARAIEVKKAKQAEFNQLLQREQEIAGQISSSTPIVVKPLTTKVEKPLKVADIKEPIKVRADEIILQPTNVSIANKDLNDPQPQNSFDRVKLKPIQNPTRTNVAPPFDYKKKLEEVNAWIEATTAADEKATQYKRTMANLAAVTSSIVAPAFSSMFEAIQAGEPVMKAFFDSIGQSINQLLSKLIAAAAEAAIFSLLVPGLGFGAQFAKILGFLPGHKDGLDFVPKDNYVARLHRGEMVLTAAQANAFRNSALQTNSNPIGSVTNIRALQQKPNNSLGLLKARGRDLVLVDSRERRSQRRGG